jgi:hypothetical protein
VYTVSSVAVVGPVVVNAGASLTAVIVTFVVWFVHCGVAAASHARSVNEQLPAAPARPA